MVPKTLLPKSMGGDGDPLDVLVLSESVPRGSVVQVKLIGILKMLDDGEQDDKLIAVHTNTPFFEINSIKELDERFEGISKITEIWFSNYKGKGRMVSNGYDGPEEAQKVLKAAIEAYQE
jgi:inorganic pyrophosphatase